MSTKKWNHNNDCPSDRLIIVRYESGLEVSRYVEAKDANIVAWREMPKGQTHAS